MQPISPQTLCPKCNLFIRTQNYLIHEVRCAGPSVNTSRTSSRIFGESGISNQSKFGKMETNRRNNREEEERIPCAFCGCGQTLAQLDSHPLRCEHREEQCQLCMGKFPKSLMQQHMMFCPGLGRNRHQQSGRNENYLLNRNNRNENNFFDEGIDISQNYLFNHDLHNRVIEQGQFSHEQQNNRRPYQRQRNPFSFRSIFNGLMNILPIRSSQPQSSQMQRSLDENFFDMIRFLAFDERRGFRFSDQIQSGLSKQEIRRFPIKKYVCNYQEQEQQKCVVCYCNFSQGEQCMELTCKHAFHPECVGPWLQKNPTCPLCKYRFGQPRRQEARQRHDNLPVFFRY